MDRDHTIKRLPPAANTTKKMRTDDSQPATPIQAEYLDENIR